MKNTNQDQIGAILNSMQYCLIDNILNSYRLKTDEVERDGTGQGVPIINITVNPIIHTSSNANHTTKNSPLRELGNIMGSLLGLVK